MADHEQVKGSRTGGGAQGGSRSGGRNGEGSTPWGSIAFLGAYMLLVGLVLGSLILSLWPVVERIRTQTAVRPPASQEATAGTPESSPTPTPVGLNPPAPSTPAVQTIPVKWLWAVRFQVSSETSLVLLVIIFGALGAYIHAVTSFADYVGNRKLATSWSWWYVLRPFLGSALALIFYVALRGGFFAQNAQTGDVNPFGVAGLAALAGLFSKQATDKLREVFETLFRTAQGKGDDQRADSLTNPEPRLQSIEPRRAPAGAAAALVLKGDGFIPESSVLVNDQPVTTTFLSNTEVRIQLPSHLLGAAGTSLLIKVSNPSPGGGTSDALALEIVEPPPPPKQ